MNVSTKLKKANNRKQNRKKKLHDRLIRAINFEEVFSFRALMDASYKCQKGVMWKKSTIDFIAKRGANCAFLHNQIINGLYRKKPARHFIINERGKRRFISGSGSFADRVVSRCLCDNSLNLVLSKHFVYDNSASQINKGTDFARDRFARHMKKAYYKWGRNACIVQYDFIKYFYSVSNALAFINEFMYIAFWHFCRF